MHTQDTLLRHAAIGTIANEEQLKCFAGVWAAMAITKPSTWSDSAAIRTPAVKGDIQILRGEIV